MTQIYVIYADICCLNRPLDDLQQSRVKLEAEAMLSILQKCEDREWLGSSKKIKYRSRVGSALVKRNPTSVCY